MGGVEESKTLNNAEDLSKQHAALKKLDSAKFSWYHIKILLVNGVGFYTDAYDIFVINFALSIMGCVYFKENNYRVPVYIDTIVKASSQVGALLGQLIFGVLSDRKGRKKMYGIELIIIVFGTVASAMSGNCMVGFSVFTMLGIWRLFIGIGLGGDYPVSAVITSEFATTKNRGAMISAVFAMQGFGILSVCLVTLMFLAIFKEAIYEDQNNLDYVWRLIIGFGCLPGLVAIYFRLKISESPRYSIEIDNNIDKAVNDVEMIFNKSNNQAAVRTEASASKKASFAEFIHHFSQWKNGKVLLGTSVCWFCLDVGFYGINMNSAIIIQAIGFSGTFEKVYQNVSNNMSNYTTIEVYPVLFNNVLGNLIISFLGLIPGYWATVFLIDRIGRKPIQILGFAWLTVILAILAAFFDRIKDYSILMFVVIFTLAQFFHNFGPNTTTFVIPGEAFTTRFRSTAHGISAATGKLGAIISQVGLFQLKDYYGKRDSGLPLLLAIFAVFMFVGLLFTFLIPETNGLSLEEITARSTQKKNKSFIKKNICKDQIVDQF